MDDVIEEHLHRVSTAVLTRYTAASIAKWILDNTKTGLNPFSYYDHEYQEAILSDTSQYLNVRKCSQVGISELSARKALALVNVISPYTVCYTLPTAAFGATFMQTRMDPIIEGSKAMRDNLGLPSNSEIKRFGDSLLFLKGAASSSAPISIPVDHLIHDEYDFSDLEVLGQYTSRLSHSKYKKVDKFSTPTLPNYGIDVEFQASKRHFYMTKCDHCNHHFIPDYYTHLRIPGYFDDLRHITKSTIENIRYLEAAIHCPKCDKIPDRGYKNREWVAENPDTNFAAHAYQITPFDAPNIVSCAYLVKASTSYERSQDFVNFALGLPAADSEASLEREDILRMFQPNSDARGQVVMGVDVGNTYYFVVGAVDPWGDVMIIHREEVPVKKARERYWEIKKTFGVTFSVIDSTPHVETVVALQALDTNLYASVYMRSKSVRTHTVIDREEVEAKGDQYVRQVNVNRSKAFDAYLEAVREKRIKVNGPVDETFVTQHTSMKRVKKWDSESGELVYQWVKTDGNDHYHHASLYCWIASQIRGVGKPTVIINPFRAAKFGLRDKRTKL